MCKQFPDKDEKYIVDILCKSHIIQASYDFIHFDFHYVIFISYINF